MRITGIIYVPRKTHKARRFIIAIVTLILLLGLAILFISAYKAWGLIHPDKAAVEPFSSNIVTEYRDVSFSPQDGSVTLRGWFFEMKGSSKTVIMVHGYGSNRLQFGGKTIDMIKSFIGKGYNVLAFDLRNSGKSGGNTTTFGLGEKDDVLGAIKYVRSQGTKNIVLLGFSTGASASLLAAAESEAVDAVIADSPYADLQTYLDDDLSPWSKLPAFPFNRTIRLSIELLTGTSSTEASPEKAMAAISPKAVFLIHSSRDTLIPVGNSRLLNSAYAKTGAQNMEYWETDAAGNASTYTSYPDEYMDRIFAFLDTVYIK